MGVFVSYSSSDRTAAEAVHGALAAAGVDVWRDQTRLEADWSREIALALSQSDVLCLIWSEQANASQWVRHEWLTARSLEIPIVACALPQAPPLPRPLANLQQVALDDPKGPERVVARVRAAMSQPVDFDYTVLPPGSCLQHYPNPEFVGREEDLVQLYLGLIGNLQRIGTSHVGCTGMGGMGKTQLLVEFSYRFSFAFDGVFWIDGAQPSTWTGQLVRLARDYLGITRPDGSQPESSDEYLVALHRFARDHPQFLLVMDNVPDPRLLNLETALQSSLEIPVLALGFSVLYSSRSRFRPPGVTVHALAPLSPRASLRLLTSRREPSSAAEAAAAESIAAKLGGLPLALALASAFLGRYGSVSFQDYARELADERLQTIDLAEVSPEELATRHDAAVTTTLASQWSALSDERARHVFLLAAQLPEGTNAPKARLALFGGPTAVGSKLDRPWERAIALLEDLHLVEPVEGGEAIRLHALVHAYGQGLASTAAADRLRSGAAAQVSAAYDDVWMLARHYAERGVGAVLEDASIASEWADVATADAARLQALENVLAREQHHLPAGANLVQQLQFRASDLERPELTAKFSAALGQMEGLGFHLVAASKMSDDAILRTYLNDDAGSFGGSVLRPTRDGRRVVASNWDNATVWDLDSGTTKELTGHGTYVADIAVCADNVAASVDSDGLFIRWNLESGEAIQEIDLADVETPTVGLDFSTASLSADCRFALAVWDNREEVGWDSARSDQRALAVLWDLDRVEPRHAFEFAGHVNCCGLSGDGRVAVVADSEEPLMAMWDVESGRTVQRFRGDIDSHFKVKGISEICFDRSGRTILTAINEDVAVWDVDSGAVRHLLKGHRGLVSDVCFSDDERLVISVGGDSIRTWDASTGRAQALFRGGAEDANGVAAIPGMDIIVTGSSGTLILWDTAIGGEGETGHVEAVRSLAATPDGRRVLSAAGDGVFAWDRERSFVPMRVALPFELVEYVDVDEQGRFIEDGAPNADVIFADDARPIAVLPEGTAAVVAGSGGEILVIDVATGERIAGLDAHSAPIRSLEVSRDGTRLFSADYAYRLAVWDLEARRCVRDYSSDADWVTVAGMSWSGRHALIGGEAGSLLRWDLETGATTDHCSPTHAREVLRGPEVPPEAVMMVSPLTKGRFGESVWCAELSEDGERAVVGFSDDRPVVLDGAGAPLLNLEHDGHQVTAAAITTDGSMVVTGTASGQLCAWGLASESLIGLLQTDGPVCSLVLSGSQLAVGDGMGRLWFFDLRLVEA